MNEHLVRKLLPILNSNCCNDVAGSERRLKHNSLEAVLRAENSMCPAEHYVSSATRQKHRQLLGHVAAVLNAGVEFLQRLTFWSV